MTEQVKVYTPYSPAGKGPAFPNPNEALYELLFKYSEDFELDTVQKTVEETALKLGKLLDLENTVGDIEIFKDYKIECKLYEFMSFESES
ncbi:hypothetical protein [Tuberibacillus sp. Marseille-P3662]|uniref:hypothetical protein n=1 Tax=Tuberibacillus sp. Marseille-P3662 TaxID=1965358 RepID=UPI000A1CE423|nr:hypothetical protein [Tuberibacillus sp. Marseille-P3662]